MIFCLVIDLFRYCIEFILCSVIQIMDMRNILSNRASKVGYEIKFYYLQYSDCTTYLHQFWSIISYDIISNYRFLYVA